ncbi:hypothetical protein LUW77_07415 [Streptomyces radiopugnans]|nr:hypothetical protein LUW77_07415 [Streptomyces radiopugnans]
MLTLAGALSMAAPAGPASADRRDAGPEAAVAERLAERGRAEIGAAAAHDTTRVNVTRDAGGWAFGTAVLATEPGSERMPMGWLFHAEREGGTWRVALEGEERFAELSRRSPLVKAEEKPLFARLDGRRAKPSEEAAGTAAGRSCTAPATTAPAWRCRRPSALKTVMTSGPHGWSGSAAPWSSLDFAYGDEVVRAARQGTAYTMCRGWIRVVHDRGYATDYYHLWNNINTNGGWVGA